MESGFYFYESCSLPTNQPIVSETDRFFIVQSESILGQMNEMTCTGADWCIHKQGRIYGNPVADGWAGAVMQKPLTNQKSYRRTNLPTYRPTD